MVGLFESYLRRLFEEHLFELGEYNWAIPFNELPFAIQKTSVYSSLELSLKPPKYLKKKDKFDELAEITKVCQSISSGKVVSKGFGDTRNSANSELVREMFKRVGINEIFKNIENDFIFHWGCPISSSFIFNKLDEIVGRRHNVAHGQILNIARNDLYESIKFLRILSLVLDNRMGILISEIIASKHPEYLLNFI